MKTDFTELQGMREQLVNLLAHESRSFYLHWPKRAADKRHGT